MLNNKPGHKTQVDTNFLTPRDCISERATNTLKKQTSHHFPPQQIPYALGGAKWWAR